MNQLHSPSEPTSEFDLIKLFEEYLSVWKILSERVSAHFSNQKALTNEHGDDVSNVAKYIHTELTKYAILSQQEAKKFASEIQIKLYYKQLYAMAALIDEQILEIKEWKIEKDWLPLMMEYSLFDSRNSGDKLIDEMQMFAQRNDVLIDDEKILVSSYLKVLWLGFNGNLRALPDEMNKLKERLLIVAELNPINLSNQKLSVKPYQCNINPSEQSRLAPISRWKRYSALAFIFYFVISGLIWLVLTNPLDNQLKKAANSRLNTDSHISNCVQNSPVPCDIEAKVKTGQHNGN
jgi:type VI protein secretion system component VasF